MASEQTREQRVREIAYRLWEQEGRPSGQDRRHWEMAEAIARDERLEGEDSGEDAEPTDEEDKS